MFTFDVTGTGIGHSVAEPKRKRWSTPRVILSEARHTEIGAVGTPQNATTASGSLS